MRFACFDRWNNPKPDITGITTAKWTTGVDGTRALDLTAIGETTMGKGDRIAFTDPRGRLQEVIVVSPEHRRDEGRIATSLICKGGIQELDDTFITDKRNRAATARQCLAKALEGTRWSVGTVDDTGTTTDLSFYHTSALEAVTDIADRFGLEITCSYLMDERHLKITGRAVNLVKAQGDQSPANPRRFEYGHDLKGITRTVDATGVKTRLYGYGKGLPATDEEGNQTGGYGRRIDFADINDGKPYVEDHDATRLWGIPRPDGIQPAEGMYENGDCEDKQQLLAETRSELARRCAPTVSYEADVLTLARNGMNTRGVALGDRVLLVDTTFTPNLRLSGRVLQLEEDLLDPASTTVTIGNIIQRFTASNRSAEQRLDRVAAESAAWSAASQQISQNAGKWDQVAQTVVDNDERWNEMALTVSRHAAQWNLTSDAVSNHAERWNATAEKVGSSSDIWDTASETLTASQTTWNSVAATVRDNCGKWNATAETVEAGKTSWNATADIVNAKADEWEHAAALAGSHAEVIRQSADAATFRHGNLSITLGERIMLTDASGSYVFDSGVFVKQETSVQ